MFEHATLAPPVIEYIAPSAAVSYPSFFPSLDQIHEAVTDSENPQFSITADETSKMSVERIQEQSAVSDLVTSVESSPVVDSVPLLQAVDYVMPESRVPAPQVREQTIVQEIPGTQVVERIQKQIAETIPQERVQRTVEQNVRTSVPTPAHLPKSLDRLLGASETEEDACWNEYVDQMGPEQLYQEWLSGAFELTDDDRRYLRESSKKKKKKNLNRMVQVMEQILEHTVESSDQEDLDRLQHDWWSG